MARVLAVENDQWGDSTPCTEWSVHDLVNHVVGEELWMAPLLRGATIEEVGSRFDGDVLGDDPFTRARRAADESVIVADATVPGGGYVHFSYGKEEMGEYVRRPPHPRLGPRLGNRRGHSMDPELVAEVATWFADREATYRPGGAIGPRPSSTGDPQSDLLAAFGRSSSWRPESGHLS